MDPEGPGGLQLTDPDGIRILNPNRARPDALRFGPTNDCSISVDPQGPGGLMLADPDGIRIVNPDAEDSPTLPFGGTDECRLSVEPGFGMIVWDPDGLVVNNPEANAPNVLSFGLPQVGAAALADLEQVQPRYRIQAGGFGVDGQILGMIFEDPNNFLFQNPLAERPASVAIGDRACRITAGAATGSLGMIFEDPAGFQFQNQVRVEGAVFAQEFVQASSGALKENVRPIERPLDMISGLNGVHFDWKDQGGTDIGFIAEEVEQVLPELVRRDPDDDSTRGAKYANLVALAVEGIKAQQTELDALREQNAQLRRQVQSLGQALEALSAKVSA